MSESKEFTRPRFKVSRATRMTVLIWFAVVVSLAVEARIGYAYGGTLGAVAFPSVILDAAFVCQIVVGRLGTRRAAANASGSADRASHRALVERLTADAELRVNGRAAR